MRNLKNVMFNIGGTSIYYFVQLVISILIAKLLGFQSAGVNSLALTISNAIYPIALYGARGFQVSDINDKFSEGDYTYMRIATTTAAILIFAVSLYLMKLSEITIWCAIAYMTARVFESFSDLFFGFFQKKEKYNFIFFSYIYKTIAVSVFFAIAIMVTKNIFIVITTATVAFIAMFTAYDLRKTLPLVTLKIGPANLVILLKKCWPLMLFSFIPPYINFIVRYFVEIIYGTEILGYYSSIAIFQSVVVMLTSSIWVVYIPMFSKLHFERDTEQIRRMIVKNLLGTILVSAIAVVVSIYLGAPVLTLLYGPKILAYNFLLLQTVIISAIGSIVMLFNTVLISTGRNDIMLAANALGAVVITACAYPLIGKFGVGGANYAMFAGILLQALLVAGITFVATKNDHYGH